MSQTERLYWIDAEIRAGRYPNATSVSEKFEISRRTAYADRDVLLERLHAPIVLDRSHGGWSYSDRTFSLPFLALSAPEARALARSLLTAREYLGEADSAAIGLLAEKLGEHVPSARAKSSETVGGSLRSAPDFSVSADLLDEIGTAIANRRRLQILYYGAHRDETTERIVQPYHLHNEQGEWFLVGFCEWRQAVRQFYLGRVRECQVLPGDAAYTVSPDFDAHAYLAQGFGSRHGEEPVVVRLIFSARQARWIRERTYHPSQQTRQLPDGRLEVELRVSGTQEIQRWALSYGADVEVVAPAELRTAVAEEARKLLKIYADPEE